MSLVEQVFAVVGIASTILLIIQLILLLTGLGGDSGAETDGGGGADFDDIDLDTGNGGTAAGGIDASGIDASGIDASGIDASGIDAGGVDAGGGDWYGDVVHADIHDGSFDHIPPDHAGSGLRLLTVQGLVAFFVVFGWSGLIMLKSELPTAASIALAVLFGAIAMTVMALIFRGMLKLQQEGTLDIRNALGKSGTVYLKVPAARSNSGKVSLMVQDRFMEFDAVTDEDEPIPTGCEVTVIGISNKSSLIVRKK